MIRINLLGAAKPKNKKAAIETSGGVSVVFIGALVMLGATVALNWGIYAFIQGQKANIEKELHKAEAENRRLSEVKTSYLEREKVKDNYKRRVDVIDQLRNAQTGPVTLLSMLGNTVDATDEVWLNTMTDEGATLELKGTALSVHGVADLMRKLQNTGFFKKVEIKETYQDSGQKEVQTFLFTMSCERTVAQAPQPEPSPATKPGKKSGEEKKQSSAAKEL